MRPHPEGGYFRETYRSGLTLQAEALPQGFRGARACSTAIYYLLERGQLSRLHRIRSDEAWHHYDGGPLDIHVFGPSGNYTRHRLGKGTSRGEQPQLVVPAGAWFGATLRRGYPYALVGCTVAPGFDFADFELADAARLSRQSPRHASLIRKLCLPLTRTA